EVVATRLDHDRNRGAGWRSRGRQRGRLALVPGVVERTALDEQLHRARHLLADRPVEHLTRPLDLEHPHLAHVGAAAVLAPRPRAELRGRQRLDPRRIDGGPPRGVDLRRLGEPFRSRHHRRQSHHPFAVTVVLFAAHRELTLAELEAPDTSDEGQTGELGDLGTDLAGVRVDGVATDQHEVEGTLALDHRGERARRRQRVRTGERRVGDEDAAVGSPRDRLAEHVFCRWRPERDHRARPVGELRELDALAHGAAAVRVQLELEPIAHQPAVWAELHRFELRHLLDQRGDPHRGSPSTRSAMMLRWISLVPPGMVAPNERRYWVMNVPCRHTDGPPWSRSMPSAPSSSAPTSSARWSDSLPNNFRIECSGAASPLANFAKPR